MNGHVREELLALYLRGDLPVKDYRNVARHVDVCPECQQTLADFSATYELLTDSLEDPEQAELAAVRSAVMQDIHAGAARPGRWVWGFGIAAAVLAIAIAIAWPG